jgi:site-specific recombinase XerD
MKQVEWKLDEFKRYFVSLSTGKGKSQHTIRTYMSTLEKLQNHFHLETRDQLMSLTQDDFINFYNEKCGKENTLNTHIRNLSAFFHWLLRDDYKQYSFAKTELGGNKFDRVPKKIRAVLNKEEVERAISAGLNLQEKLMVAMMFKTALRRSEIARIKLSHINNCEITITGKGGDEAHTYLNERLCAMLNDYLVNERNTDSEFLFYGVRGVDSKDGSLSGTSINARVQACVRRAGINKKVTAHTTRRTAITRAALERSPLAGQMLARHKNLKTTMDSYVFVGDEFVKEMLMEND